MNNKSFINPSMSGSDDAVSVTLSSKNQWAGFPGAPKSRILGINIPVKSEKIGSGIQIQNTSYGIQNNLSFIGNYAYRIPINKGIIALGLGLSITQKEKRWSEVVPHDFDDDILFVNNISSLSNNISIGTSVEYKQFSLGFSALNLFANNWNPEFEDEQNTNSDIQIFQYLEYKKQINEKLEIIPSQMILYNQTTGIQLELATQVEYRNMFCVGLTYRSQGSLISLLGYQFSKQLSISYSYGFETANSMSSLGGSHELGLKYLFLYELNAETLR